MLIDYRAFFRDWESIKVAAVMIVLITAAKYIAVRFTAKTFKLSSDQRTVIFGLEYGSRSRHARSRDGGLQRHYRPGHPTENRSVCWAKAS